MDSTTAPANPVSLSKEELVCRRCLLPFLKHEPSEKFGDGGMFVHELWEQCMGRLLMDRELLKKRKEDLWTALKPFAVAHDHAAAISARASLGIMDSNDYFMWQANRRLCQFDFKEAKRVFDAAISQRKP